MYLFEDEEASTISAGNHYLYALEDSDICIFLIDNADGIRPGVQAEVDTVKKFNIKALYYFCDENQKEKTALEPIGLKVIVCSLIAFAAAAASELLATSGFSLIDWEAGWAESGTAMAAGMAVAALIAIIAILVIKKNAESRTEKA